MKLTTRLWFLPFILLLTGILIGCQTYDKFARFVVNDKKATLENPLIAHHSPMVSYPAQVGCFTGMIAAIPLDIPFSMFYRIFLEPIFHVHPSDNNLNYIDWAPSIVVGALGETVVGGTCWMLLGGWESEPHISKSNAIPDEQEKSPSVDH